MKKLPLTVAACFYIKDQFGRDPGELVWKKENDPFCTAMNRELFVAFSGTTNAIDTSGVSRNIAVSQAWNAASLSGLTLAGTICGTATTAYAPSMSALGSKINHGSTANLLFYGAQSFTAVAASGSNWQFTMTRSFTNNSGGTITIQEIGVYALSSTYYFMLWRDLTGGVALLNTKVGTVVYTISTNL